MTILREAFSLTNGVLIPKIGLGTWQIPNDLVYQVTLDALEVGYRHIDTANGYNNENGVGRALKASGIPRADVFITSKLPSHIKGYQATLDSFAETMQNLDLEVLDLYLIHAPWPWHDIGRDCTQGNIESFKAMIDLYHQGRIRAIGVSNFSITDLQAVIDATGFVPHVNQIRFYISDTQSDIVAFCQQHGILVEAYSPLATGRIVDNPKLQSMAAAKGVTVAQVCIRYCLEKNTLPLPKTTSKVRMMENAAVDFVLSPTEVAYLDSLELQ